MEEAVLLLDPAKGVDERPEVRANRCYERAKHIALVGGGSSIELERTLRDVLKALSLQADQVPYYLFLAKIYKNALDITSAIFCYRYAIRLDPKNFQARRFMCELLIIKGKELMTTALRTDSNLRFRSARACFDEALEIERESPSVWVLKAVCHVHLEENLEAYECINRIIRGGKGITAEMYVLRAKIQWARGLTEQGNSDIKLAARLNPDHPEVLAFTVRSYSKAEKMYRDCVKEFTAGNYKEALLSVNYAIHITTDDIKLLLMQSKIHRKLGDLQSAYESMVKAKDIFSKVSAGSEFPMELPSDIVVQVNLILNEMAINYAMKGDYDQAILLYNKIIKTEKETSRSGLLKINHKYFVNRGDCYRALHRLFDAVEDYEMALKLEPSDWGIPTRLSLAHYLIATDIFNGTGDFHEAIRHLDKAVAYNPKVAEYYVVRGKALYYTSDFNKAFADFRRALELDETREDVRERLAQFDDLMTQSADPSPKQSKSAAKGGGSGSGSGCGGGAGGDWPGVLAGIEALQPKQPGKAPGAASVGATSAAGAAGAAGGARTGPVGGVNFSGGGTGPGPGRSKKGAPAPATTTAAATELRPKKVDFHQLSNKKHPDHVLRVKAKEDDIIDMMLVPKQASKLPTLRLMSHSADAGRSTKEYLQHDRNVKQLFARRLGATYGHRNREGGGRGGEGMEGGDTALQPHSAHKRDHDLIPDYLKPPDEYADLPELQKTSAFRDAFKASLSLGQKQARVLAMFEEQHDHGRGALWGMVETAKDLAYRKSHPVRPHHPQLQQGKQQPGSTPAVEKGGAGVGGGGGGGRSGDKRARKGLGSRGIGPSKSNGSTPRHVGGLTPRKPPASSTNGNASTARAGGAATATGRAGGGGAIRGGGTAGVATSGASRQPAR